MFDLFLLKIRFPVAFRIGKIGTPPGLAKIGPFRIGKIGTLADWQKKDPSGLAKIGPFQIGKTRTLPD